MFEKQYELFVEIERYKLSDLMEDLIKVELLGKIILKISEIITWLARNPIVLVTILIIILVGIWIAIHNYNKPF